MSQETIIKEILPAMTVAASAHNTQPWTFKVESDRVNIFVDWNRHLTVSDPYLRELYISIGCVLTNALVAAKHHNYRVNVTYFPQGSGKDKPAVELLLTKDQTYQSRTGITPSAINDRRTDRTIFDGQPLTDSERRALPTLNDANIILVADEQKKEQIGEITRQSTLRTLSRQDFKAELSRWVRSNWTTRHDGMPFYAMQIPAPLSLFAPTIVKLFPIHKQEAPATKKQIQSASLLAIIATTSDTPTDWVKSGQLLEQLWLEATAAGLVASPLVAAIEAGDDTRSQLKQVLNTDLLPQSLLRLGHAVHKNPLRATPRRTVAECLV